MSDYAYCPLCGNVNRADLGPVTGMCLDGRACRRRQAGLEPANPEVVTAATCKIRAAHTPHGECLGTAPEFPWERIIIVGGSTDA